MKTGTECWRNTKMVKDESVRPQMIKIWVDDEREMPEGYDW